MKLPIKIETEHGAFGFRETFRVEIPDSLTQDKIDSINTLLNSHSDEVTKFSADWNDAVADKRKKQIASDIEAMFPERVKHCSGNSTEWVSHCGTPYSVPKYKPVTDLCYKLKVDSSELDDLGRKCRAIADAIESSNGGA